MILANGSFLGILPLGREVEREVREPCPMREFMSAYIHVRQKRHGAPTSEDVVLWLRLRIVLHLRDATARDRASTERRARVKWGIHMLEYS